MTEVFCGLQGRIHFLAFSSFCRPNLVLGTGHLFHLQSTSLQSLLPCHYFFSDYSEDPYDNVGFTHIPNNPYAGFSWPHLVPLQRFWKQSMNIIGSTRWGILFCLLSYWRSNSMTLTQPKTLWSPLATHFDDSKETEGKGRSWSQRKL